ncbi:hypothetical protein E4U55_007584 [Claviceps digitariae]|nr:hypothetical protein E4U55_007584 [Claviceps digitariae]
MTNQQNGIIANATSQTAQRHEEHQYLDLIREILDQGEVRPDRTGTGTISIFAPRPLKFSLNRDGVPILPLLTTKRVFLRAVIAELLWFIEGNTSSLGLSDAGVKIWDGNGSREFLDSLGLTHREVGDLGPVYGFQWRHFGAEYIDAKTDYNGKGVDQLADVIEKIKNKPYDRRIIMSAWNARDLHLMALPPCHVFAQFYVSYPSRRRRNGKSVVQSHGDDVGAKTSAQELGGEDNNNSNNNKGHLNCQLYQRSCDMGLGVPFNIASYALLTHMIAHACDLVPGTLTHVMGDAHVYADHEDALNVQLEREPRNFPELEITRDKGCSIDGWKVEDFVVKGYDPHKTIAMKMSV